MYINFSVGAFNLGLSYYAQLRIFFNTYLTALCSRVERTSLLNASSAVKYLLDPGYSILATASSKGPSAASLSSTQESLSRAFKSSFANPDFLPSCNKAFALLAIS